MSTIENAFELADKVAGIPGDGQSFASFARGQGHAPSWTSAADMAGAWIAMGWIRLDPHPTRSEVINYMRGFEPADGDIDALNWLASQAGNPEGFVERAIKTANYVWVDHWDEVYEDILREEDDDDRLGLVDAVEELIEASGAKLFATGSTTYDADGLRDWAARCEGDGDREDYYVYKDAIVPIGEDGYIESVALVTARIEDEDE